LPSGKVGSGEVEDYSLVIASSAIPSANKDDSIAGKDVKPFPIPKKLNELCQEVLTAYYPWKGYSAETTLVNFYTTDSTMGLHVDKDEENHLAPVIGLNFGSTCRFFFEDSSGEMRDIKIPGNSIYIFGKSARLMRHGLGSIYSKTLSPGSEGYLKNKERINLTIRQVYS
jgi:alkylated DNA repair protein (DNA oxidative demethylase)